MLPPGLIVITVDYTIPNDLEKLAQHLTLILETHPTLDIFLISHPSVFFLLDFPLRWVRVITIVFLYSVLSLLFYFLTHRDGGASSILPMLCSAIWDCAVYISHDMMLSPYQKHLSLLSAHLFSLSWRRTFSHSPTPDLCIHATYHAEFALRFAYKSFII